MHRPRHAVTNVTQIRGGILYPLSCRAAHNLRRIEKPRHGGGGNIGPREVDEALYSHPDVIEAAAFGVACENYGQRVEAGVKLSEHSVVRPDDLMAHCRKQIGHFKAPDQIHFLPDLPKGPSGKIQRKKLAELVRK